MRAKKQLHKGCVRNAFLIRRECCAVSPRAARLTAPWSGMQTLQSAQDLSVCRATLTHQLVLADVRTESEQPHSITSQLEI